MNNTRKAVELLDRAVPQYLDIMQRDTEIIDLWIERTFEGQSQSAVDHLKDQWYGKEGHFDDFYLNLDDDNQRAVLESFDIRVEPEKYADSVERTKALIKGASPWECHPFETYTVFLFLRFAYNHNLEETHTIFTDRLTQLENSKVAHYGNGENWGRFYQYLAQQGLAHHRHTLVEYMLEHG